MQIVYRIVSYYTVTSGATRRLCNHNRDLDYQIVDFNEDSETAGFTILATAVCVYVCVC